jgi:hypothetical protein
MNHIDLLKRAFHITWRYKPLWLFGFLLALCSGGSGGGGNGGSFNYQASSDDFENFGNVPDIPNVPDFDPNLIIGLIAGLICLIMLLAVVAILVTYVSRTALIGMVGQIEETEAVTISEGWRLGWSRGAWRLFLLNLLIGIPLAIFSILLLLLAFSPLLLMLTGETALTVVGVILTIFAVLFVILILILIGAVIAPFRELASRRTVLDREGVVASLRDAIGLVKRRFRDVVIIWLLMLGIGFAWAIIAILVVLPVSLIAAVLLGGIPAGLVYLISRSWLGAAVAGIPLAGLALIIVSSAAGGLYLIFQSTVWTLTYLEVQKAVPSDQPAPKPPPALDPDVLPAEN